MNYLHIITLFVLFAICSPLSVSCQIDNAVDKRNRWFLSVSYGKQNSDDRFFNYVDRDLFKGQPISLQSTVASTSIGKTVSSYRSFSYRIGIGLQYSRENLRRPFNESLFDNSTMFRIFRILNSDTKLDLVILNQIEYSIDKFGFLLNLQLNNQVYRQVENSVVGDPFPFKISSLNLRSLDISPGLRYHLKRVSISTQIRLLNISKNDKVIFGTWIKDSEFESKKIDTHNPFQIRVSASYWL